MDKKFDAYRIFNGTYTDIWIDSIQHYEAYAVQAKIAYNKEDVNMCGELMTDTIVLSGKGTGSLSIYKTDSSNLELVDDEHPNKRREIIFSNKTPDAFGGERIRLTGVTFDETTLADYEAAKPGKVTLPFTFTKAKILEKVEATI